MTVSGHLHNGVVVLDSPTNLPDGTTVRVEIPETAATSTDDSKRKTLYERFEPFIGTAPELPAAEVNLTEEDDGPTLLESLKPFIGIIKDMPPDMARNHDHYLYGTPKQQP